MQNFDKIVEIIKKNNDFCIISHINPDGDAIGSALALAISLQKINKRVKVCFPNTPGKKYKFLLDNLVEDKDFEPKVNICVDVANYSMISDIKINGSKVKIQDIDISIDHHISNKGFAKINYVKNVSSNTINIYYLLKALNIDLNSKIAKCIYVGICTDTGCFRNSNTNKEAFEIASVLYNKIYDFENLNQKIFNNKSIDFLKFKCKVFESIDSFFDDKCVFLLISINLIDKFNINYDDLEEIPSSLLEIENTVISFVFKEKSKNLYKVSVRSKGEIDVCKICVLFGGGGHKNAGGFIVSGEIIEIKENILKIVRSIL